MLLWRRNAGIDVGGNEGRKADVIFTMPLLRSNESDWRVGQGKLLT